MSFFGKLFGSSGKAGQPARAKGRPKGPRVNIQKRFTIVAETGQGSMSRVYKALDNQTGRSVCLKVQDKAKTDQATARWAGLDRPSEGEIGKAIVDPHVVRTYEFGQTTRGEHFVTMEFIDGVSFNFLRQSKPLELAEKLELLAQAADGLAAVHRAGFVHHDFGPKNLLVNRDDQVKLIDFGLTVPNTAIFHRPGNRLGTLRYMAPELVRRETTDEKLDIFSFGATAFEFLTGRLPYDVNPDDQMALMRMQINSEPLKLAKVAPHLPPDLGDVIDKTLAKRPRDRWPRMDTLADALRELPVPSRG